MPLVDFSQATELVALPEDTYDAILEAWEYHPKSKSSGKPYVGLKFVVQGGEHDGRSLFRNHSLEPKALWAFKRTLVRLGADGDELTESLDLEDLMPTLIGASCKLQVTQREYREDEDDDPRIVNDVKNVLSSMSFS